MRPARRPRTGSTNSCCTTDKADDHSVRPDGHPVAPTNPAATDHGGIRPDVDLMTLCRRSEDLGVARQIALGEGRHHAPLTRPAYPKADSVSNRQDMSRPIVLEETVNPLAWLEYEGRTETPVVEASSGVELLQTVEDHRRTEKEECRIEERPGEEHLVS